MSRPSFGWRAAIEIVAMKLYAQGLPVPTRAADYWQNLSESERRGWRALAHDMLQEDYH